jgi:hypothetical protein
MFLALDSGCSGTGSGDRAVDALVLSDEDSSIVRDEVGDAPTDVEAGLEPLEIPAGCNPLAASWDCLLPWPSDVFRRAVVDRPGAVRVTLPGKAAPALADGNAFDPFPMFPGDGFSVNAQILALFPGGIDPEGLVHYSGDLEASRGSASPTVIIEARTGRRILHFAERDPSAATEARRALILRPLERLSDGERYVVALRGLRDLAGAAVLPPEGFRRLRDRQAAGDPVLGPLSIRYESDVFPVLASAGIDRDGLVLAWDFTTRSAASSEQDLLAIREDALARFQAAPPDVRVVSIDEARGDRRITGTLRVPLYLETDQPGALLARGPDGIPAFQGQTDVDFWAYVPRSVLARSAGAPPARLVQYGHGFFGRGEEIFGSPLPEQAELMGAVLLSVDWWGFSVFDFPDILLRLTGDPSNSMAFVQRAQQGMVNALSLAAAANVLAGLPAFQVGGSPAFAPAPLFFYGNSLGAILGGTYAAISPDVARAAFGVGGAGFVFIMTRSKPFDTFLSYLKDAQPDPLEVQKILALMQTPLDRVDPLSWAPRLRSIGPAGAPPGRPVLLQNGLHDAQVHNQSTFLWARALGVPVLEPAPFAIQDLGTAAAPIDGSALALYDFGVPGDPAPTPTPPAVDTPPHNGLRLIPAAMAQIDAFLRPGGSVVQTCSGPCDPE